MLRTVRWITLIIILVSVSAFADEIYLKNGTVIKGRVLRVTTSALEYDPDGEIPFKIIDRDLLKKIVYSDGGEVVFEKRSDFVMNILRQEIDDVIYLTDGRVVKGKVVKLSDSIVEYVPSDRDRISILKRKDIEKIEYGTGGRVTFVKPFDKEDASYKQGYPVVGLSVGTPGLLNIIGGYYFPLVGFHLSGSFMGTNFYGIQGNIQLRFYETENVVHGFSLIGAYNHLEDDNHKVTGGFFVGPAYNLNLYGFFVEFGLAYYNGEVESDHRSGHTFVFQLGYVARLF